MIARVICCNDFPEAVALGDEEFAARVMKDLKDADKMRRQDDLGNVEYNARMHWHVKTVRVFKPPQKRTLK